MDNSDDYRLFEKGDKPTRCNQNGGSVNSKTIDFTGVVHALSWEDGSHKKSKLESKTSVKLGNNASDKAKIMVEDYQPSSLFEPIYHHMEYGLINVDDTCTGLLYDYYGNDLQHASTNGIILDESSVIDQDQGKQGWHKYVDIDLIGVSYHYGINMASAGIFEEELEVIEIPDDATEVHSNVKDIFCLEDPKLYNLYDVPRSQMDSGAKCSVTNKLNLLCKVKWYNKWFRPRCQIKGATCEENIVPESEGYLQVPTMQEGKFIEVLCYYSPKFTSTLLSDIDILKSSKHAKEYSNQLMLKFFEEVEIDEMTEEMQKRIQEQVSTPFASQYDHNYGNCILQCIHKQK